MNLLLLAVGLIAIGIMLFIHELGHFAVARLFDVDVEVLSFGIGPKLIAYQGKRTEYRISLIPFGGYCRMQGSLDLTKALQDNARTLDKAEAGSYFSASPIKRFLIYLAGPLTNFILAVLLLSAASMIPVERLSDEAYATPVSEYPELFGSDIVQPGIKKWDKLIASGDKLFTDWQDAEAYMTEMRGTTIPLTVLRDGVLTETEAIPSETDDGWAYGIALLQRPVIGRTSSDEFRSGDVITAIDSSPVTSTYDIYSYDEEDFTLTLERDGEIITRDIAGGHLPFAWKSDIRIARDPYSPLPHAIRRSAELFYSTLSALGAFLTLHLQDALDVITGPVKAAESIGSITAEAFSVSGSSGLRGVLQLLAVISVSLSAGNILPIPTFDGGQMLVSLYEAIRRKALSPRTYVLLQIIGIILALLIMAAMYALDLKAYFFS